MPTGKLFPAYAGVIPRWEQSSKEFITFPRLRGGDPRTNGKCTSKAILFPAYAGVIPRGTLTAYHKRTFPRLRGGDPGPKQR